ncbi:hypothetical protein V1Y59_19910 [Gordonia sp. PKS22-38]|uniref:Uncharacterized protein n=1 Tax=Gordonia prachuapensis TaxID=3115651 RepID=A0ABU7MYX3_9ACTN|nr:hypothetical protein [Gordonia sp. PKS22-38]
MKVRDLIDELKKAIDALKTFLEFVTTKSESLARRRTLLPDRA